MKCKKAKKNTQLGEKPAPVKTHLRDAIIMPEMVGNFVAVHNGKAFNIVEIKFDMIGRYLGEFSLTYKHTKHGKAGVGATKGSTHTALKWYNKLSIIFYFFILYISIFLKIWWYIDKIDLSAAYYTIQNI